MVDSVEARGKGFSTAMARGVLRGACIRCSGSGILTRFERAGVAQLVEHLICNQRVGGSIPSASSTRSCRGFSGNEAERILAVKINGLVSFDTSSICVFTSN